MLRLIEGNQRVLPWILCLFVFVVYLAFPTMNYYWDGVSFAQTIERAQAADKSLIHPNHLLYNYAGYFFYHTIRKFGFEIRALPALQLLNNLLATLCAAVFFVILKRTTRSLFLSFFLTLLFALSATWWKFATDANAYIASVFFILSCFYLLLPGNKSRPELIAILFSLSMLFHQLAVLFGFVIVFGLYRQNRNIVAVIRFGVVAFLITAGVYCYAFYTASNEITFARFLRWISSYSPDASFTFNVWNNLFYTLRGHSRLFFNGRFNLIKGLMNPFMVLLLVGFGFSVVVFFYSVIRKFKKPDLQTVKTTLSADETRTTFLLALIWSLVYIVFLFFWLPQNTFYRLFYLPALILLVGVLASVRPATSNGTRVSRLVVFVVALALSNFVFFIYPYSHAEKFPPVGFAIQMRNDWPAGAVVYFAAENSDNLLFNYLNPSTSWRRLTSTRELDNELGQQSNTGVWLEASAIAQLRSTPEGTNWLDKHTDTSGIRKLNNPNFNIAFVKLLRLKQ